MKSSLCLIYEKQAASFKIMGLILAIAPLWLMLAATTTSGQTSSDVSSSSTTSSPRSETVLNVGNVGNLQLKWNSPNAEEGFGTELSPAVVVNDVVYVDFWAAEGFSLNASTGAKMWGFEGESNGAPPVVANGVAYIASTDFSFDSEIGTVHALNAVTGAKLWSFPTASPGFPSVTVSNGVVYVGSFDGTVYALNASTGAKLWSFTTGGSSFFFVVANGGVCVGSNDGNLYGLNANTGAKLWSFATGNVISSPGGPPVAANGVVYVGSADGNVYALNASTGTKLWSFTAGGEPSPLVANGVVYVGSNNGHMYALNASTGVKIWNSEDGVVPVGPDFVANGLIYVSSNDGHLYALNASTGGLMWGTDPTFGGLAAVANGVVYTIFFNSVFALDGSTGVKLWSYSVPFGVDTFTGFSGVTVVDGTVYVSATTDLNDQFPDSATGGTVYAFSVGADLFLRAQPSSTTVHQGDLITYSFPVWDLGPTNAVHEVLNTQVPPGTTFDYVRLSGTPGLGTCTTPKYQGTGQIICHENGTMAANTTWTVRLTVKVTAPAGTVITESAAVLADSSDPNSANNTATVSIKVQ